MTFFQKWKWQMGFALLALLILFLPLPTFAPPPIERHIRVEASMFQFTPGEVTVNPGDKVTIELVSTDVVHGFSLDGYDFNITSDPGQTAVGTFVANKPGVFRFRCSAACGNLHPFMVGKLHVGPDLLLIRAILLGVVSILIGIGLLRPSSSPSVHSGGVV